MLQLFPCPKCQQATALESSLSEDAELQCPHCDAEFILKDLLLAVPQWKVTRVPSKSDGVAVAPIAAEYPDGSVMAGPDLRPGNSQNEEEDTGELELSPVDASGNKKPTPDWSNFEPITHEQFERNRRKQRSPIWSVLQIVLGGLAAFPIALLILWHGFDTDIGDIGPKVAAYAPWIVPARFHPYEDDSNADTKRPALGVKKPKKGESGFRNFDSVLPPLNAEVADDTSAQASMVPDKQDLQEVQESAKSAAAIDPQSMAGRGNNRPADEGIDIDEPDLGSKAENTSEKPTGDSNEPSIFELIQRGEQDLQSWVDAYPDKTKLRAIAKPLYGDLTAIAESIEKLPIDNPVLRPVKDRMRDIGRKVKQRQDVQELIQKGCEHELAQPHAASTKFGLALIVSISQVEQEGENWQIQADSIPKLSRISVPKRLAPALSTGKKLLLLGTAEKQSDEGLSPDAPTTATFSANYLYGL